MGHVSLDHEECETISNRFPNELFRSLLCDLIVSRTSWLLVKNCHVNGVGNQSCEQSQRHVVT